MEIKFNINNIYYNNIIFFKIFFFRYKNERK